MQPFPVFAARFLEAAAIRMSVRFSDDSSSYVSVTFHNIENHSPNTVEGSRIFELIPFEVLNQF